MKRKSILAGVPLKASKFKQMLCDKTIKSVDIFKRKIQSDAGCCI